MPVGYRNWAIAPCNVPGATGILTFPIQRGPTLAMYAFCRVVLGEQQPLYGMVVHVGVGQHEFPALKTTRSRVQGSSVQGSPTQRTEAVSR